MKPAILIWAFAALCAGSSGIYAQQLYRCGSTYQDKPCAAGAPEKVMRSSAAEVAPGNSTLAQGVDPYCIKRGTDAQQIVWSRESGKTAEDLSRQAQNDQQRQLIAEVYALRGSAPQVRDAIQAQCQRDRERMGASAMPLGAQGGVYTQPNSRSTGNSDSTQGGSAASGATGSTYNNCDYVKQQMESIRNQERQGGSIQTMESLKQRRYSVEKSARAQGC